jgi:hypothetical protein
MADAGGNPSEQGRLPKYTPSYDAPTTPIPRVRDEPPPGGADDDDTAPRRWPPGMGAVPRGFPTGDGEERLLVGRREPNGPFPSGEPPARPSSFGSPYGATGVRQAANARAAGSAPPVGSSGPPAGRGASGLAGTGPREGRSLSERLLNRVGDIPIRVIYTVGAALATAATVVMIFLVFSGDEPDPVEVDRTQAEVTGGPSAAAPAGAPPVTLPPVPKAVKALPAFPGQAPPVAGGVLDEKAGIGYAMLAEPWRQRQSTGFSLAQRIGAAAVPKTLIASRPLPGRAPGKLSGEADYRRVAASAVRWAVRNHHPAGSEVTWTASTPAVTGTGWVLGFRVRYELDGRRHTSQAAVAVVGTGADRPALLLVTIPDSHKDRWSDIPTVLSSIHVL